MKKRVQKIVGMLSDGSDGYTVLIRALQAAEGTVRHDAIQAIVESGERCLPFLTEAMDHGGEKLVSALLWEIQKRTLPWTAGPLKIAMRAKNVEDQGRAMTCLAHFDDPTAAAPIAEALMNTTPIRYSEPHGGIAQEMPLGEALGRWFLYDHSGHIPIIWIVEYLGKHGDARCTLPLLRWARTGAYAIRALSAIEQVVRRDARSVPDNLLFELSQLAPIPNLTFQYCNDNPDDLRTSLQSEGMTDPKALKHLAQSELTARRANKEIKGI